MALFKSQLVTQASGSIGGVTFTRTNSGMVMRARSMPVNPSTALQQAVRNATSLLAGRWSNNLTEEQRENWAVYAANITVKNKLGDSIKLSAMPMYIRCNVPRLQASLTAIDDAPTVLSLGDPVYQGEISQNPMTPFGITFTWTESTLTTEDSVLVYASIARSSSINFFKGPYRYNGKAVGSAESIALAPNPTWVEGQKIFLRAQVAYADGRLSPSTTYSFVLTGTPV